MSVAERVSCPDPLTSYRHQKYPQYQVVISEVASISRDQKDVYTFTAQVANCRYRGRTLFSILYSVMILSCDNVSILPKNSLLGSC